MYELVLHRTSLLAFAGLALVEVTEEALARGSGRSWLVAGIGFGLGLLLQVTLGLLLLSAAAVVVSRERTRALRPLVALAAGVGLCLAPGGPRYVTPGVVPL